MDGWHNLSLYKVLILKTPYSLVKIIKEHFVALLIFAKVRRHLLLEAVVGQVGCSVVKVIIVGFRRCPQYTLTVQVYAVV